MHLFKEYLPSGLLLAFVGKILIQGASLSDVGVAIALVSYAGLEKYLEKSKKINDIVLANEQKWKEIAETVNKQNEVIKASAHELALVRDNVAGMKLAGGMQSLRRSGT